MSEFIPIPALYVVATPIGHPDDITLRALKVLASVDLVAAEDTRVTGALLKHHHLSAKLISIREHNEKAGADYVVKTLQEGKSMAYVSDAGTPAVSDPGALLVAAVHEAGLRVIPIPGASALTALLSASGWLGEPHFIGFLPAKGKERSDLINRLKHSTAITVLYEAPHRLLTLLDELEEGCGSERSLCLGKELTKSFEAIVHGNTLQLRAYFAADPKRLQGEFVLLVAPKPDATLDLVKAEDTMRLLLTELPRAKAAKLTAKLTGISKDVAYQLAL